jgi:four helix bundle protein
METTHSERGNTFFRFEDLRIYHKSLDYIKWVHEVTAKHIDTPNRNLAEKFNEAAHAIAINIAEGSARNKSQFIYYLKMAKSSVRECLVFTSLIKSLDLINDEEEDVSRNYLMEMTKMTGALISSLQRGQGGSKDKDYDDDDDIPHSDRRGHRHDMHVDNQMEHNNY